ncbi:MAG: hypothetical protein ACKOYN_12795 [Planctomycetota bacterium]
MSVPAEPRGPSPLAMLVLLGFMLAAVADQMLSGGPYLARRYVEVKQEVRVEAERTDADGKTERAWVAPDDAKLASGEWKRVADAEPVEWTTRTPILEREYRTVLEDQQKAAEAPGSTAPARVVEPSVADSLGIWVGAFLTLAIFSFLWRDNAIYKIAESLLVGVSAGYWMVNGFWTAIVPKLLAPLAPSATRAVFLPDLPVSGTPTADFALALVPLALGFLLLWRLAPRGGWIAVWPLAFIIGTTAGLKVISSVEADLIAQAAKAMQPLVVTPSTLDETGNAVGSIGAFWGTVGAIVSLAGVLSVLVYFFFSFEHKGAVGKTARVGIWFLMVTLGSAFGLTVMGRITLLSQRFEFLFKDWLGIMQ